VVIHSLGGWFYQLKMPPFCLSDKYFPVIWVSLFSLLGIALSLIWMEKPGEATVNAVVWYFFQLTFHLFWVAEFFVMRVPALALWVALVYWLLAFMTWRQFRRINQVAGWLLVPYLLWISYMVYLNWGIYWLNR